MQNIKKLSDLAKIFNITYIYAMYPKNHKIYFISSSALDKELKKGDFSRYFDEYKDATKELRNIFKNKQNLYETATDKWRSFRSVLIPKVTSNGTKYILGADLETFYIESKIKKMFYTIIFWKCWQLL